MKCIAFVNGLIDREAQYGAKFHKPPLEQTRRKEREHKAQHGERMFEAASPYDGSAGDMRGMGQSDLANLPLSSVDLDGAIIDYPRPKTEAMRFCPLWPIMVEAIREWLPT